MITKTTGVLIALSLLLGGCKAVPPAHAQDYLEPSTPEAAVTHEVHFEVRAGLKAVLSLSETEIMVQVNQGKTVKVRRVNLPLMREWGERYLKIHDYDRDGMNDIAILRNAGRGGKSLCYAVYRYNPRKGQFRKRKSFDRCRR